MATKKEAGKGGLHKFHRTRVRLLRPREFT